MVYALCACYAIHIRHEKAMKYVTTSFVFVIYIYIGVVDSWPYWERNSTYNSTIFMQIILKVNCTNDCLCWYSLLQVMLRYGRRTRRPSAMLEVLLRKLGLYIQVKRKMVKETVHPRWRLMTLRYFVSSFPVLLTFIPCKLIVENTWLD